MPQPLRQPPRPYFGKLLTEAISSVAKRKQVNMEIVEADLAIKISESEDLAKPLAFYTAQRWMRGFPPSCERMKIIVEFCVHHGRIPRDLAEGLLKQSDCEDLLSMLDDLFGQYTGRLPQRIYSNLPRRNLSFRGRGNEMAWLIKRLSPENRAAAIVIYGLGGIGKTTLATEVAHACLPDGEANLSSPYEAAIFTSARDRTLTLTDVLDEIGRVLEYPAILRQSSVDKIPLVQDRLGRCQVLLIIDNFETIADLELIQFALEGVPAPSKVLIATRDYDPRLWPGTWPIQLEKLDDVAALQLVREWAQDHDLAVVMRAKDAELEPLLRATEGNPFALMTALGLIAHQKQPLASVLRDLWEGRGQIFDYIFGRVWALLEEPERHILIAMPVFTATATQKAIGATAGVEGYPLSKGLGHLTELSLVMTDTEAEETLQRYRMHPLTRAFAAARLAEMPEFEEQARARWSEYFYRFADQCLRREKPKERYWNSLTSGRALPLVDPEWPNLRSVLEWADNQQDDQTLVDLMLLVVHYMDRRILFQERLYYAQRAAEAAKRLDRKVDEALLRIDGLGWTLLEDGRFADAEEQIKVGLRIAQGLGAESVDDANDLMALANTFLARVYLLQGNLTQASAFMNEGVSIPCRPMVQYRVNMIAGDIAHEKNDNLEAIELYKEGASIGQQYGGEGLGFEMYYRLGFAYLATGNIKQAADELQKGLLALEQGGITIELIQANYGLACIARANGENKKARQLAEEARDILFQLDPYHSLLSKIAGFLKGLEKK